MVHKSEEASTWTWGDVFTGLAIVAGGAVVVGTIGMAGAAAASTALAAAAGGGGQQQKRRQQALAPGNSWSFNTTVRTENNNFGDDSEGFDSECCGEE